MGVTPAGVEGVGEKVLREEGVAASSWDAVGSCVNCGELVGESVAWEAVTLWEEEGRVVGEGGWEAVVAAVAVVVVSREGSAVPLRDSSGVGEKERVEEEVSVGSSVETGVPVPAAGKEEVKRSVACAEAVAARAPVAVPPAAVPVPVGVSLGGCVGVGVPWRGERVACALPVIAALAPAEAEARRVAWGVREALAEGVEEAVGSAVEEAVEEEELVGVGAPALAVPSPPTPAYFSGVAVAKDVARVETETAPGVSVGAPGEAVRCCTVPVAMGVSVAVGVAPCSEDGVAGMGVAVAPLALGSAVEVAMEGEGLPVPQYFCSAAVGVPTPGVNVKAPP